MRVRVQGCGGPGQEPGQRRQISPLCINYTSNSQHRVPETCTTKSIFDTNDQLQKVQFVALLLRTAAAGSRRLLELRFCQSRSFDATLGGAAHQGSAAASACSRSVTSDSRLCKRDENPINHQGSR